MSAIGSKVAAATRRSAASSAASKTVENLYAVAKALGIPFGSLFTLEPADEELMKDVRIREVVGLLRSADKNTVRLAHEIVRGPDGW